MPRQAPQIREAVPEDARDLLEIWAVTPRTGVNPGRALEDAERALANMAADPDQRLLVAEADGRIVAAVKLGRGPISPLSLEVAVHTSYLVVAQAYRRHGYGHALLDAALTWAEEKDIGDVTAITDGNRETNRFFARLGLSTLGTMRHSSVAALRKKLTAERGHHHGNRHLVEVLAQRRSMRRRQETA
jgi:GNAT superfamily N-acetyltransferase